MTGSEAWKESGVALQKEGEEEVEEAKAKMLAEAQAEKVEGKAWS